MQSLIITLNDNESDLAESLMFQYGASAVTFEDAKDVPLLEPKPGEVRLWPENILTAWFEEEANLSELIEAIEFNFPLADIKQAVVAAEDWQKNLHDQFKPLFFGERLCICPSWEAVPEKELAVLMLDPGLAFGTGTHPTTALCLTWLSNHLTPGQTVLDYGCGSGILGLAALKLGASKVWAVDYDPQAIQSTLANAEKNQITPARLTALTPEKTKIIPKVDIIIANILATPLIELAATFKQFSQPGTKLILSGILDTQYKDVEAAYQEWVHFIERQQQEDWMCLVGYV